MCPNSYTIYPHTCTHHFTDIRIQNAILGELHAEINGAQMRRAAVHSILLPFVAKFFLLCLSVCLRRVVSRCICLSIHLTLSFHVSSRVSVNLCVLTYMYCTHKREHLEYAHTSNANLRESRQEANVNLREGRQFLLVCSISHCSAVIMYASYFKSAMYMCTRVCRAQTSVFDLLAPWLYNAHLRTNIKHKRGAAGQNGWGGRERGHVKVCVSECVSHIDISSLIPVQSKLSRDVIKSVSNRVGSQMFYTAIQFQFSRMAGDVDFDPNANKREKALISTFWNGFSHAKVRISCKPCFLVVCADMDMCVGMQDLLHMHTQIKKARLI